MLTTQTSHHVKINASPDRVYLLLEDVTAWPQCFPPNVHDAEMSNQDGHQDIQLWALANGHLKTWQSSRVLEPALDKITFAQTKLNPPLTSMVGTWTVEPTASTETCLVSLGHEFSVIDDNPTYIEQVRAAVDENSEQELNKLKVALENDAPVTCTFEDSINVKGPIADAYDFIYDCDQWPRRLNHVVRVQLEEEDLGLQVMTMTTRAPDGSEHETKSGRVCFTNRRIIYIQFQRPRS